MNSNREGTMGNDKAAATYGTGQIVHWPVGMTKTACGLDREENLPVTLANRKVQVTCERCNMALAVAFGHRFGSGPTDNETTGEHVWNKLQDDLYADFEPAKGGPGIVSEESDLQYRDDYAFRAENNPWHLVAPAPKRGWTPTPGEVGLALGIVVTIVLLFCFIVVAY